MVIIINGGDVYMMNLSRIKRRSILLKMLFSINSSDDISPNFVGIVLHNKIISDFINNNEEPNKFFTFENETFCELPSNINLVLMNYIDKYKSHCRLWSEQHLNTSSLYSSLEY
jgi:hypothetical protein